MSKTATCYRNTPYIHRNHGDVLKGSFELLHERVNFKILKLKVFEDADIGSSSVDQAHPTVEIIFEVTYRGEGGVWKVQFGFKLAWSAEQCLVLLQEK